MSNCPTEPTSEQCGSNAEIRWTGTIGEEVGFACWYPQMGGYGGKCVVSPGGSDPVNRAKDAADQCFDVYVWHDGEFPFGAEQNPAVLHHCLAQQFINFGETVNRILRTAK